MFHHFSIISCSKPSGMGWPVGIYFFCGCIFMIFDCLFLLFLFVNLFRTCNRRIVFSFLRVVGIKLQPISCSSYIANGRLPPRLQASIRSQGPLARQGREELTSCSRTRAWEAIRSGRTNRRVCFSGSHK